MPDPNDYLPPDKIYVKGYVRSAPGTAEPKTLKSKESSTFGIIVWWITLAIEIIFILALNPIWIMQNLLLVLIIMALIIVASMVVVTVYKRSKRKNTANE